MKYRMRIGIRYKVKENPINFNCYEDEINDAAFEFNGANLGKKIEIISINKDSIDLEFDSYKSIARPLKEISAFSRKLNPLMQEFSSVPGKLFKAISIIEIDENDEEDVINTDMTNNSNRLVNALEALIKAKDFGSEERRREKNQALKRIEEIIDSVL